MTKDRLVKENEKDNKDQTFLILNNIKALLTNNIKQVDVKVGNLKNIDIVDDLSNAEGSGGDNIAIVQTKVVPIPRITITTTTTTAPTTQRTTTTTTTPAPGFINQIVNGISNGLGGGFRRMGTNVLLGAGFAAAAASPLWAPLLVGKKRRRRELMNEENEFDLEKKINEFENNVLKKLKY